MCALHKKNQNRRHGEDRAKALPVLHGRGQNTNETEHEPGGWRAACVHLNIKRSNTGESFVCTFGIEVPMANDDMPISIPLAQLRQEKSPEDKKREARWAQELGRIDRWHAFLRELRQDLPNFTIGDGTATPDACFRCVAYPAKGRPLPPYHWIVVGCVSILAPIYIVYSVEYGRVGNRKRLNPRVSFEPFPPELKLPADVIARKIQETFGFSKLPSESAKIPVPLYVKWVEPPETTLFHALFTNEPDNVP